MLTVDVDEGTSADIGHTGTAVDPLYITSMYCDCGFSLDITFVAATIHATTNGDLPIGSQWQKQHQQS